MLESPLKQTLSMTDPDVLSNLLTKYMGNQLCVDMMLSACQYLGPAASPLTRYRRLSPSTVEALVSITSLGLDFVWISTSIGALHWELRCIHLLGGFENQYWVPWSKSLACADKEYQQRREHEAERHKGKVAHEQVRSELVRIFEGHKTWTATAPQNDSNWADCDSESVSSETDSAFSVDDSVSDTVIDSEDEYWASYDSCY